MEFQQFEYLSPFTRKVLQLCAEALAQSKADPADTGLVLVSTCGSCDVRANLWAQCRSEDKPLLKNLEIPDNVPSSTLGKIAKKLSLGAPCISVSALGIGLEAAVGFAEHLLGAKRAASVICCYVEFLGADPGFFHGEYRVLGRL